MTRAGIPVAAMAEHIAYLRWLMLILRCQRRQVLVGANMRPPRHMLPNAPCPERWVPPPRTRGILATARPVPHDSADVWWPVDKEGNVLFNNALNTFYLRLYSIEHMVKDHSDSERMEMFYLTTHSTHFIYGYMASDIW